MKPFLSASNAHKVARPSTVWSNAAKELRGLQTADFQQHHIRTWDDYPSNRYGWVTDTGRLLGVGNCAKSAGRQGERIARIDLPYYGSGRDLRNTVRSYCSKPGFRFRVVRRAA